MHCSDQPRRLLQDALEAVEDVREYDVPFHMRWAIDMGVRCGWWYTVRATVRRLRPPCTGCLTVSSSDFIL